jgi:DNA-binding CsgD family transcriptional regulator
MRGRTMADEQIFLSRTDDGAISSEIQLPPQYYLRFGLHTIAVPFGSLRIGRGAACEIRLEGQAISRVHAVVGIDDKGLYVRDERSRNGVFVNGVRIHGQRAIFVGDCLAMANEELFVTSEPGESQTDETDAVTKEYGRWDGADAVSIGLSALSQRERQVFKMLAQGFANRDIGDRLQLSPKTIATYRARLTDKLGVRTRANLVDVALRLGILSADMR